MFDISKELIGFDSIFNILKKNLKNNTLSNSLILYGNKGIGKNTFCYYFINFFYKEFYSNDQFLNQTNRYWGDELSYKLFCKMALRGDLKGRTARTLTWDLEKSKEVQQSNYLEHRKKGVQ